jgi:hypothetical protein
LARGRKDIGKTENKLITGVFFCIFVAQFSILL